VENDDQRALRRWIQAGLAIGEVRNLHGDAGYILNNMIAKYTLAAQTYRVSVEAERNLHAQGVAFDRPVLRGSLYGKSKPTIFEHAIPAKVVRERLLASSGSMVAVGRILSRAGPVVIILRTENTRLRENGLSQKMPPSWKWGDDVLARHTHAGIAISDRRIRMIGAIKR
jgi:hypothetical protein